MFSDIDHRITTAIHDELYADQLLWGKNTESMVTMSSPPLTPGNFNVTSLSVSAAGEVEEEKTSRVVTASAQSQQQLTVTAQDEVPAEN